MPNRKIENWGLKVGDVPWGTPPEMVPYFLVGEVDGQAVNSRIMGCTGETFACVDGNSYELGQVHPGYDAHCNGKARELMLNGFKSL